MIPRVKANFSIKDLLYSFFILNNSEFYKIKLKNQISEYFSNNRIILTPSGRAGLFLILSVLRDVDEVLIPSYTCNAVVEAIKLSQKKITYIKTRKNTFNIDLKDLKKKIKKRTAVIATPQFGFYIDMEYINNLCKKYDAILIEDVAGALGSKIDDKIIGNFGDFSFFSFDLSKTINVPLKSGFILINNKKYLNKIKEKKLELFKPLPINKKINYLTKGIILNIIENHFLYRIFFYLMFDLRGIYTAETNKIITEKNYFYKYEMSNWQAYIAYKQFKNIDEILSKRKTLFLKYIKELKNAKNIILPNIDDIKDMVPVRFPILVKSNKMDYYKKLTKQGVDTAFSFSSILTPKKYVNAHFLANSVLNLPFYNKLTVNEQQIVINHILKLEE